MKREKYEENYIDYNESEKNDEEYWMRGRTPKEERRKEIREHRLGRSIEKEGFYDGLFVGMVSLIALCAVFFCC